MHLYTKVGEKITGGWCLHSRIRFTRAHLVLTNLLITSLLVLCFSQWFLLFLPPKFLLISLLSYRLLFWYLLFRYRWAHHLCFLSMNDLSRSSFFDSSSIYLRENHRRVVFTQQDTIYSRAHLVLTNLLITSLLILCCSRWFVLILPPIFFDFLSSYRLLFWYLLFRYRWAHHLCFLSVNDLS